MSRLLLCACIACLMLATVGSADEPIAPGSPEQLDGLLAYWKLDEAKGTSAEDSRNKLKATLRGGQWCTGVKGSALQFNKNGEYLDFGDSPLLNFKAGVAFTFSGWVKSKALRGPVVSLRNNNDNGAVIDLTLEDGKLAALVRSDHKETGQHSFVTGGLLNDGDWHHFALTRDTGVNIELFIDGISQGKSAGNEAGGPITTNLRALGSERAWVQKMIGGSQLVGAIDEFCVFDRALSDKEIRQLAGPQRTTIAKKDQPVPSVDVAKGPKLNEKYQYTPGLDNSMLLLQGDLLIRYGDDGVTEKERRQLGAKYPDR